MAWLNGLAGNVISGAPPLAQSVAPAALRAWAMRLFSTVGNSQSLVKEISRNAAWLRANPGQLVLIEGHCDNRGATSTKNEFNMDLGERRAQAAMNYLIAQDVHPSRITILSYGEERPQCTEESERCWSQNRRSRFLVKPR
jgi:peptidoglycan-associated lipoprotein